MMTSNKPNIEGKSKIDLPKKRKPKENRSDEPLKRVHAWWVLKNRDKDLQKEDQFSSILVKFITKQEQYSIPQSAISVKENVDSLALNHLVSSILEKGGVVKEIPVFEFMINGKILVNSIGQHLKDEALSFEATTEVEYYERHPPPTPKDHLEHDDWVSSVMCSDTWLLTGCYDSTVVLWSCDQVGKGKKAHKLTIPAHKAPVKAVSWVRTDNPVKTFVSCSIDQTAIVWEWDSKNNAVECIWECRGHAQSVECLGVEKDGSKFATGSWDNSLKIWDAGHNCDGGRSDVIGEPNRKKSKKRAKQILKTPIMTLAGHSESVSGIGWMGNSSLVSCSWDHSIRLWDIEIGGMVSQISGNVSFFCVSYSPINNQVLAGCADRHIRLYDIRANDGSIVQNKFSSHTKWVPSIRWSGHDEHLFVSGGYDNSTRVWDTRSSKAPLYDLLGHSDKVLAVDWSVKKVIASGSADCTAQLYLV